MTQKELDKIIKNHQHWLNKDCIGWENMKANLRGADLGNLSIANVDLRHACLEEVNLSQSIYLRINEGPTFINGNVKKALDKLGVKTIPCGNGWKVSDWVE